jgi:alkyl hydroperoxide reductase subunit AhpC
MTCTGRAFVTKEAPDFKAAALMPDGKFNEVSLSTYKGKYVVLFFYPLDFTFVCPTEICDFSDRANDFKAAGAEVVAASVDSLFSHLAWTEVPRNKGGLGKINIPIIADLTRTISKDYGVLMEKDGHTLRGLFIIDGKGIIRHLSMNDPSVGRNVDEVLRLVQAFQFTDKHGEVCPSGWKPGQKTMKTDPSKKDEFFGKH